MKRKAPARAPDLPEVVRALLPLTPAVLYVLLSLSEGKKHGYAIMQETSLLSRGTFRMGPGTLYTTIQRLVELNVIAERDIPDADSRRRYYELTADGRKLLQLEIDRLSDAVRAASKRLVPGVLTFAEREA